MQDTQVVGVPAGTFSMTPSRTSLSKPSFTASFQWRGTCDGVRMATGLAVGSTYNRNGSLPVIIGNGWWEQVLKALEA